MKSLVKKVVRFLENEGGPTAVEYALMLMLIFLAVLTTVVLIGQTTTDNFESSANSIQGALDAR